MRKHLSPLLLSLACLLLVADVAPSQAPPAEAPKKAGPKEPGIKLDVPGSMDIVSGKETELEVKVAREGGFEGPVKLKLTGTPDGQTRETEVPKDKESAKFPAFRIDKGDSYKLKIEASGGEKISAEAEIAVTIRRPDPVGDGGAPNMVRGADGSTVSPPVATKTKSFEDVDKEVKATNDFVSILTAFAGKNRVAMNLMWTLVAGFLVMFMQTGFAMVETGLTRSKNVAHTMAMNIMIYGIGMLGFWICGFALMFGGSGNASTGANWDGPPLLTGEYTHEVMGKTWGLFGHEGFFLLGNGYDIGIMTLFLFQMVFMDTAATIPTGAMAERWKFLAFCIYGFFISMLIYPIYGNWVWGGGWLSQLGVNTELGHGHVDFAGSSVVHMVGGVCALAGILVLGPRLGKYNKDGTVNALPAHNVPMYVVGTLILAFGWFGFNPGSALQIGNDLIAARCAANTMLASGAGAVTGMLVTWVLFKKPDPSFMCNGMLAGLVAITAPCAFVAPWAAVVIGLSAGTLVVLSCLFFERVVKVDDPVGAVSVHGVCGVFGILSIAIFADGTYGKGWNNAHWVKDTATGALRYVADLPKDMSGLEEIGVTGLIYGNTGQLYASLIGIGTNFVWVFGVSLIVFLLIGLLIGNRVSEQVEREGLDIHEMGVAGYIEDDPKVPEGHLAKSGAEPRPASAPHNGENRFTLVVQGADQDALTKAWSALCQPSTAPSKDFLLVYPHMMTVTGNRFRFRGGDPDVIRGSMESLLQSHIKGARLRAIVER